MFALKDFAMNDHSFHDDLSRRLYDPSHPLYGRKAFSDVSGVSVDREEMTELGPWGTRLLYAGLALVAAYFGLILVFGTH